MKTSKAVAYVRVSTDQQAEKGLSLPAQLEHCQKYAREHGLTIAKVFQDEGETATSSNRPEFLEMIDYARTNADVSAVIVYDTSRFARNREDAVVFKRMLEKRGVKVHYAAQMISDDPEGKFLEGILEVMDEHYSRVLARVVRRGMIESAKRGNWMGGAPYGYKIVRDKEGKRKLEIDPSHAEAVRLTFEMFDQRYGCKKIAQALNDKGYRTSFGSFFRVNSVNFMLRNPAYTGKLVFNRFVRGHRARRSLIPPENWVVIPDTHEPLITEARFKRVQEELGRRSRERKPGLLCTHRRFAGMVQCAKCGKTAVARTGTSKQGNLHFYYACRTRIKKSNALCSGFSVRMDALESSLIDSIQAELFSDKSVTSFLDYVKARAKELDDGRAHEKIRIQRKLEAVQVKLRKIVLLAEDDSIDAAEAKARTKELHAERQELMDRYVQVDEDLALKNLVPTKSLLEAAKKELQRIVAEAEPRVQRDFFSRFIKSIKTDGKHAEVVYNLGDLVERVRSNIHVSAPGES
jgi:DNA invertase Pin-like site-specific DNA recombinase